MSDELYEQWRREKTGVAPSGAFTETVMRQVRQEANLTSSGGLRRIGQWLDRHPFARVAVIGGAMVAGVGRIAAILALLLAA